MRFQLCRANFAARILFQNHVNVYFLALLYHLNETDGSVVLLHNGA